MCGADCGQGCLGYTVEARSNARYHFFAWLCSSSCLLRCVVPCQTCQTSATRRPDFWLRLDLSICLSLYCTVCTVFPLLLSSPLSWSLPPRFGFSSFALRPPHFPPSSPSFQPFERKIARGCVQHSKVPFCTLGKLPHRVQPSCSTHLASFLCDHPPRSHFLQLAHSG